MKKVKLIAGDTIRVYSTKDGTQWVRPSDVLFSEEAKKDMRLAKEIFDKLGKRSVPPADSSNSPVQCD